MKQILDTHALPAGNRRAVVDSIAHLAWAGDRERLQDISKFLCRELGIVQLAVYEFRKRRSGSEQLRLLVCIWPDDKTALPTESVEESDFFRQLVTGSGDGPEDIRPVAGADHGCLRLTRHGQVLGFLLLGPVLDEPPGLVSLLQRFAIQVVSAARRIAENTRLERHSGALDQLFQHTSESFCQWSRHTGWRYHNQHLLHRIGYAPDLPLQNVFGHPETMSPGEWIKMEGILARCIARAENTDCEYQVRSPDGEPRTFWTRLRVLKRGEDGSAEAIAGVSVDITATKKVEFNAQEHSDLQGWLLEQNSRLFNRCDREAVIDVLAALSRRIDLCRCFIRAYDQGQTPVYAEWRQAGVQSISELNPSAMVKTPDFTKAHFVDDIETRPEYHAFLSLARQAGTRAQMILPMSYAGTVYGYLVCHSTRARQWNSLEKRAARVLADSLCMVTVKEKIQQRLESSREQFQSAMEAASYGLWEFDIRDQSIYISPHYLAMLGYEVNPPGGFRPLSLNNIHHEDRQQVLDYARALSNGSIGEFSYESRHIGRHGELLWILMRGKVIKWDDTGSPLRAMGTLTDITALKNTQTDLKLARKQAESAHRAKSEFLARMSHEIRTPMNVIIGTAYLALQSKLDETQRAYVQDIDAAARGLLRIIDDILDFSKIEAGKLLLEQHRFELPKLIEDSCAPFTDSASRQGLRFVIQTDDALPTSIVGDRARLQQILNNLLSNAFKFTRQGSVGLKVTASALGKDNLLIFEIRDTGIGLNGEQIERLSDPFTQGDNSSTRQYGGTGLGLAISTRLIRMMGGDIQVSSRPGQGSVFRFALPFKQPLEEGRNPPDGTGDRAPRGGKLLESELLADKRVLLVEDNPVNQKVAVAMLEQLGISTTVASDGEEALELLSRDSRRFDLILMDIEMPRMNGFEASAAIRKLAHHRSTPLVAMTAHAVEGDRNRYLKAGMDDCISKPIMPDKLRAAILANLAETAS